MRIFVAAILPEDAKDYIEEYINEIRDRITGVKWEKKEKLHITLKYIGDIDEIHLNDLSGLLRTYFLDKQPVKLEIKGFGGFPNLNYPRVLVIEFGNSDLLTDSTKYIDDKLGSFGFQKDHRRYIPHATIGRVKSKYSVKERIPELGEKIFCINRIEIINSVLTNSGSVYNTCYAFNLGQ